MLRVNDRDLASSTRSLLSPRLLQREFPLSLSLSLSLFLSLCARSESVISILQVEFLICLLLTILGYIPGIIYALYAIIFVDRDQYFDEYRRPLYSQY